MTKIDISEIAALKEYKENLSHTYQLISMLILNIKSTDQLVNNVFPKLSEKKTLEPTLLESLAYPLEHTKDIYAMGFIQLMANFEFFMYSLLKEIASQNPYLISKRKTISLEEIREFADIKELNEYIIDQYAIENSYGLKEWKKLVERDYSLELINPDTYEFLEYLNELRNALLHSGGKTNSKTFKTLKKHIEIKPLSKYDFTQIFDEDSFRFVYQELSSIGNKQ